MSCTVYPLDGSTALRRGCRKMLIKNAGDNLRAAAYPPPLYFRLAGTTHNLIRFPTHDATSCRLEVRAHRVAAHCGAAPATPTAPAARRRRWKRFFYPNLFSHGGGRRRRPAPAFAVQARGGGRQRVQRWTRRRARARSRSSVAARVTGRSSDTCGRRESSSNIVIKGSGRDRVVASN